MYNKRIFNTQEYEFYVHVCTFYVHVFLNNIFCDFNFNQYYHTVVLQIFFMCYLNFEQLKHHHYGILVFLHCSSCRCAVLVCLLPVSAIFQLSGEWHHYRWWGCFKAILIKFMAFSMEVSFILIFYCTSIFYITCVSLSGWLSKNITFLLNV